VPEVFIKVILALLAVAFVAYPLLTPPREEDEDLDLSEDLDELHRRKESTFSAIKELEFDFRTGKLSEEDFRELDARYRTDALELIDAIEEYREDDLTGATDRAGRGIESESGSHALIREWAHDDEAMQSSDDGGHEAPCGECGAFVSPAHRFCATCGAAVVA